MDTWSIYLDMKKKEVAKNFIYCVKFPEGTLVARIDPSTPEAIKEKNKVWQAMLCEADLESSKDYWARMESGLDGEAGSKATS